MKKNIFYVLCFFASVQLHSQNKYSKIFDRIITSYDQNKLTSLVSEFSQRQIRLKNEAETYARINNIPMRYEKEDGTLLELQYITEDGIPIYYTTFNVDAAISTRTNFLNSDGGLGLALNGDDLIAHVWDGGLARGTHQEYDGSGGDNRFSIGDASTTLNFHAAHVTGREGLQGDPQAEDDEPDERGGLGRPQLHRLGSVSSLGRVHRGASRHRDRGRRPGRGPLRAQQGQGAHP
jgi:hypothetical protein